jgi:hypothetical protein
MLAGGHGNVYCVYIHTHVRLGSELHISQCVRGRDSEIIYGTGEEEHLAIVLGVVDSAIAHEITPWLSVVVGQHAPPTPKGRM